MDKGEQVLQGKACGNAGAAVAPSGLTKAAFVERYGGVFEHSPWIAERAFDAGAADGAATAEGLHAAMAAIFRAADEAARLEVLLAHPDLAGKLAAAKRLTADSTAEQAGAGLDALTDAEREAFTELNGRYRERFGFPFIIAVKGLDKAQILQAFQRRVEHDRATEFSEACRQVERIARLRLEDMHP